MRKINQRVFERIEDIIWKIGSQEILKPELVQVLPKVDLHQHIDGCLRPETIVELANKYNIELTRDNTIDIRNRLTDLEKNFLKFDSIITEMSIYQKEKVALQLQITQSIDMKIEALREALQLSKSEINSLVMRFESLSDTTGVSSSEAFSPRIFIIPKNIWFFFTIRNC